MASLLFNYSFTTRIHDIDAAGVMFFARFFYHIHDAYEDFLNHQAQSIKQILNSDFILPISHTEANFKAPIVPPMSTYLSPEKFSIRRQKW
ncbi:MAG: hypothetical protein KZQ74_14675 [gamma proteobacterium symbiont of Bathyaustriella thionipta]|nr:hypothetical protein [gamma proteobacterium symbiont of Bathyaustriella thionipta]MCU7951635.1 hypothetical protein [gamma proteobacterium symbiont of Bathyaustriella thionipta]MCU7958225.1 hypothetical protein [gamma proteobacterium symbiont of Bathyaustriella thionipta]MCU7968407.1 hypothetical protein [gamma proteobacterium symbiont of Bathyaustriella thionipta]